MNKFAFICMLPLLVNAAQDGALVRTLKVDFQQAISNADKSATLDNVTALWRLSFTYMLSIAPSLAREQVVIPLANWVKNDTKKRPQILRTAVKPFLPANAGLLIAIFLEADLAEDALLALFILTKAEALYWAYPDTILVTALAQLLLAATISADYIMPIMIITEEKPFTFFSAKGPWGCILHLLVDLVVGKTEYDLPSYLIEPMASLAKALENTVRTTYPALLQVCNSANQTAFALAAQKADAIRSTKPNCAKILDALVAKEF